MPFVWTDEKVDDLQRHWDTGDSCTVIGAAMGISRNAVIGKVHRLGLNKRGIPQISEAQREASKQRQRENHAHVQRARRMRLRGMKVEIVKEAPPIAPPFIGALNIPFADLRPFSSSSPNQCRYIADEPAGPNYFACGNETMPGESWCGHCRAIVYPPRNMTQAERQLHIHLGVRNHQRSQRRAA